MITKNDCLTILVKLEDEGVDKALINKHMRALMLVKEPSLETLQFISQNRGIDVANFYEMLRRSYNAKKSPLYINIVRGVESLEESVVVISALLTQIALYGRKLDNSDAFYKSVRATELASVLAQYYETGDASLVLKMLALIKSDLLVLEFFAGRREQM